MSETPTQARALGKDGPTRVLCVYGSESGNAKRGLDRVVKKWKAAANGTFEIVDVITGNALAKRLGGGGQASAKNLEYIAQMCDVLILVTSSYGSGDPPSNMRELTGVLMHEASMKSDALTGVQHAVLGFGSSTYTTFQNIPRLSDKFLGECGSRRMVIRAEIDEHDDNPGEEAEYHRWSTDVLRALQALPAASTPPVCEWSKPEGKIAELEGEDEDEATILGIPVVYAYSSAAFAVFASAAWYLQLV